MTNLQNLIVISVLLLFNLKLSAQTLTSPLRIGVKFGFNSSNATVNDAANTDSRNGYHIGAIFEYSLSERFLVQSGLYFSTKGSKVNQLNKSQYIPSAIDDTHTFNQSYVTLPVYGAYKLNVTNQFKIIFGVGPYFGYGIGGKTTQKLNSGSWSEGITQREWNTFGNGVYDQSRDWLHGTTLKRFDIGAGANIDFEYHKFILGVGYEKGLRNIAVNENASGLKYKNNNLQVSFGYRL
ncbi:porin family protein [Flavobacterium sp. KBS0721]|uniref:porin family protein n=1 Tax=Flavobacterium sp. KBS0721 TaxID=1179672 RepID=UPI0009901A9F|nr:porin family protein [Flavobacterium sp. KBS0721]QDW21105.1 PorT family protein [Flavobacterium sp. KBS0721]